MAVVGPKEEQDECRIVQNGVECIRYMEKDLVPHEKGLKI
jgi:hypothetical protein